MAKSKKARGKDAWAAAKKKCRLNQEEITMAKALGLNPRKLIAKHTSCQHEHWKESVGTWIRTIYGLTHPGFQDMMKAGVFSQHSMV